MSVPATSWQRFSTPAPSACTHRRCRDPTAPARSGRKPMMISVSGASSSHLVRSVTRTTRTLGSTASIAATWRSPTARSTATTQGGPAERSGGILGALPEPPEDKLPVEGREEPPRLGAGVLAEEHLVDRPERLAGAEVHLRFEIVQMRMQLLPGPVPGADALGDARQVLPLRWGEGGDGRGQGGMDLELVVLGRIGVEPPAGVHRAVLELLAVGLGEGRPFLARHGPRAIHGGHLDAR